MNSWTRFAIAAVLGFASLGTHAQTCTTTVSPGADISTVSAGMGANTVLCLNPGTYTAPAVNSGIFPNNGAFAIGNSVTVKGLGAGPANTVLQASAGSVDHTVYFVNYVPGGKSASNASLVNLTVQGSQGGVQVQNFTQLPDAVTRLTDIKLKDVVITTVAGASGFGVKLQSADRIVLDNVTVTSGGQAALNFLDTTDSLVMNSTVPSTGTANAVALSVLGGSGNRFVNNSFGQPRSGGGYSFNGGGVVFYNTSDNRFEANTLQGMKDDALDFTIVDNVAPVTNSLNNYVGKNQIIHTAFALDNKVLGSAGIWSNCGSHGTWIYGNETRGAAECGICIWNSRFNMAQGNLNYNNGIAGIFVSGGSETHEFCTAAGGAFDQKPVSTFLQSNANYFNKNEQLAVRNADSTDITRNFASPNSTLGGPAQACTNAACQASMSLESDGTLPTTGIRALANTSLNTVRGLWNDSTAVTGLEFFLNRTINSTNSRFATTPTIDLDRGSNLGGNYWSSFIPAGNPSNSAFTGVFDSTSNTLGRVIDRFPFQSENLGRGWNVAIFEPRAGSSAAQGSRRTVRWDSIGCVFMDLSMGGSTLASNIPNIGYAVVTIPPAAPTGNANVTVTCKDSAGTTRSVTNSPTFAVTAGALTLLSPGRDDVFNAGQTIWVAWKNTNPGALTSVSIDYSTDGGATWPTLLATVAQTATTPITWQRVTLPATGTAYGAIRVRSGTAIDQTDGVFAVRGAAGAFANVASGRAFVQGQMERLEWSSPTGSRLVTITATVSGATRTVATDLPDRGSFDWIVPDFNAASTVSLTANFKTITGAAISAVTNAAAGVTRYPTTITLGAAPTIGPGSSGTLSATANSGVLVTLTSSPASVCTVSGGTTINGVANGTCTVTATAPATGVYAAALPTVLTFAVGATQTITFTAPGYIAVGGTINLSATASSGLPVTFASLTQGVCSVSGNIVTGNTNGTCTVQATQAGNGTFAAAQPVNVNINSVAAANIPRLVNISTRGRVLTGADVMIGGFIIGGNAPKTVVIRGNGPSLNIPGRLGNPLLQLFSGQTQIAVNDDWQQAANAATIQSSGFAPLNTLESAIYTTLNPGAYTAILSGSGGTTGIGLVEVFEVNLPNLPLINISTRGQVQTGDNVMIAGFIIQGETSRQVVIRARGPSMTAQGLVGALANPNLQIFSGQTQIAANDNWQQDGNAATVQSLGFAPSDPFESAILMTLAPGAYTAIVTGVGGTSGVGIVEVFTVN